MGIQEFVRWISPREHKFYDYLERQMEIAKKAAQALAGSGTPSERSDAVQVLEHEGDEVFLEFEEALARTFVTPIDREDLHLLASELDSITDLANGAARAAVLFGVDQVTVPMRGLMDVLLQTTDLLNQAIPMMRKNQYAEIVQVARQVHKLEKDADTIYRNAISALFKDPNIDAKTIIREKAILDDLESSVDHCHRLGKTLANIAVKHG